MKFEMICSQILLLVFLIFASACSATALNFPKMGVYGGLMQRESFRTEGYVDARTSDDFQRLNYTQTLDHFNYRPESYATFQQRYAINFKYWGGANTSSPIFVYTGDEDSLDGDLSAVGFLTDNGPRFKALLVFIEHRYYGLSVPFGSTEEAYQNTSTLGYFSSSQALADYAQLIIELKKNLSAENCPVIAMGGSYGGMLAAWFRLKYPHIAIGAFASSAPILYFDDITPQNGYLSVVTKDFRESSESCYETIKQSWFEIDKIASQPNGLALLSQKFKTCSPLSNSQPLKDYLARKFKHSAQYDYPWSNPVDNICKGIDSAPQGTDVLGRIAAGLEALGGQSCYNITESVYLGGWSWQVCTEMVMPIGGGDNDTMFEAQPFDLNEFTKECKKSFGVTPRPHWITTEFGGHNIKPVLERFGSNIIFSNGLKDPYSSGGVLYNISDSIVAIYTEKGSHCLDILASRSSDPKWLTSQREAEIKIIEGWIAQYNTNTAARTNSGVRN